MGILKEILGIFEGCIGYVWRYIGNIWSIYWEYLKDKLGIFEGYISKIFEGYNGIIERIYFVFLEVALFHPIEEQDYFHDNWQLRTRALRAKHFKDYYYINIRLWSSFLTYTFCTTCFSYNTFTKDDIVDNSLLLLVYCYSSSSWR